MKVADIKDEIRRRLALPEFTAGGKNGLVDLLAWINAHKAPLRERRAYHHARYVKTRKPKHGLERTKV